MIKIGFYSDDRTLHQLLSSALGKEYRIQRESEEAGLNGLVRAGECDVLILDLSCHLAPLQERVESARRLIGLNLPAIIMADDGLRSAALQLVRNGAFGYCRRPPSIRDLKAMLNRAFNRPLPQEQPLSASDWIRELDRCGQLIGSSSRMQRVYQLVRSVASLNAAVLVTGQSGTGKELIARAIHNLGSREDRPFVAVSCGAIPETLIEAELFGHEKGAFTGSVGTREGYFEQAADGTLFLDEIGDLSLYTQVKLLRVLQQMKFSRLGSSRLIPLRARLIFATHRDLAKLVAEGKFRQDLFYRINVMRIESPALQEHAEDIPMIAEHFLRRYSELFQKHMTGIEREALEMLQSYAWPGNVRELENVIQRAIILAPGSTVRAEDLCIEGEEEDASSFDEGVVEIGDYLPAGSFERQLRDYKVRLAIAAVRENNGNKTLAARSLRISRAYLHRLIRLAETDAPVEQNLNEAESA